MSGSARCPDQHNQAVVTVQDYRQCSSGRASDARIQRNPSSNDGTWNLHCTHVQPQSCCSQDSSCSYSVRWSPAIASMLHQVLLSPKQDSLRNLSDGDTLGPQCVGTAYFLRTDAPQNLQLPFASTTPLLREPNGNPIPMGHYKARSRFRLGI